VLLSCLAGKKEEDDKLFENIIGYDNVKRLYRMALQSPQATTAIFLFSQLHQFMWSSIISFDSLASCVGINSLSHSGSLMSFSRYHVKGSA
jgi:hypothetical protein